ncbi:glycogen/starch synthase [Planctomycetes bacterium Pan216]
MCSSEVAPFAKTGGLADVVGSLPAELWNLGHDVRIVMPFHGCIDRDRWEIHPRVDTIGVPLGFGEQWCSVHETRLPETDIPVYLIEHHQYFARVSLYQHDGEDYDDNAERFAFFSRACCQLCKAIDFAPDVMHAHDWQAGLVPVYLKTWDADHPLLYNTASVMSIHNLGYQGVFPKDQIIHSQLGWERFTPDGLEFYDQLNYLKPGILYADKVSTVSPTYAREIQLPEHGWALDGVLRDRSADLVGILNGCDYREWDPSSDKFLERRFDAGDLEGKRYCKAQLQREMGLPVRENVPIVGMVTRLAYQKGVDVLASALPRIFDMDLQFVVLGTGEVWAHFFYGELPSRFPDKAGAFIGFDLGLAHLVMAGCDYLLMPSRYEPCGLSQLASKRYGTLPIVRATGGLEDTVANYDEWTGDGDGFKFYDLSPGAIGDSIGWAVSTFYDRPHHLEMMKDRAMRQRYLWSDAAMRYEELYGWAIERRRS